MSSRAQFETAMRAEGWSTGLATWIQDSRVYQNPIVQNMWEGWQLRQRWLEQESPYDPAPLVHPG